MSRTVHPAVLYAASVTPLEDEGLYAAAYAAASPERQEKTDRLRMPRDRRLSLGAELLLRYALRSAGADWPPALRYGANGKPCLQGNGLSFNLSHSGDWALCAAADCEVGCDAEKIGTADLRIAERYFHESEYAFITSCPSPEEQNELFYRYWTLKESFLKTTGLGLSLSMDAFAVALAEEISVKQAVDSRRYSFREYADIPGYRCALCAAGELGDVPLQIMDLRALILPAAPSDGGTGAGEAEP